MGIFLKPLRTKCFRERLILPKKIHNLLEFIIIGAAVIMRIQIPSS